MMMRYLGNTMAKPSRKGMLQYRDFSSSTETVVTTGSRFAGLCFKGAFLVVDTYVLGGLATAPSPTSPATKLLEENEEILKKQMELLKESEADLERMKKQVNQ